MHTCTHHDAKNENRHTDPALHRGPTVHINGTFFPLISRPLSLQSVFTLLSKNLALSCGPSHPPVLVAPQIFHSCAARIPITLSSLYTSAHPWEPSQATLSACGIRACICLVGHGQLPPKPKVHLLQLITLTALSKEAIAIPHMQVQVQHNVCLSGNVGSELLG